MVRSNDRHITLETPRLILREWEPSDWRAAYTYARLPEVYRFMTWGPNSPAQTRAFIRRCITLRRERSRAAFEFAVVLKDGGRLIGGCGLRIKNRDLREADLGYCLYTACWGKGYGTELAKALRDFGFHRLRMRRIWATCDVLNHRSEKVLRKIGMKKEGCFRKHMRIRGRWRSSYFYAILETDRRPK
jgi:RimJ/RimL family protein N-acetyltransferase